MIPLSGVPDSILDYVRLSTKDEVFFICAIMADFFICLELLSFILTSGTHPIWVIGLLEIFKYCLTLLGASWVFSRTDLFIPIFAMHRGDVLTALSVSGLSCLSVLVRMEILGVLGCCTEMSSSVPLRHRSCFRI